LQIREEVKTQAAGLKYGGIAVAAIVATLIIGSIRIGYLLWSKNR